MVSIGGYHAVASNQEAEEKIIAAELIQHPRHSLWITGRNDTLSSIASYPAFHPAPASTFEDTKCKCKFHTKLGTGQRPLFNAVLKGQSPEASDFMWRFLFGRGRVDQGIQ